jgi:hypothetical protein
VTSGDLSKALEPLIAAISNASAKGWYEWVIGGLAAFSLALVAWSTVLTRRMQQAAHKQANASLEALRESVQQRQTGERMLAEARTQNQLAIRPIVILDADLTYQTVGGLPPDLQFKNMGNGPAFHCVALGKAGDELVIFTDVVPLVEKADSEPCKFEPKAVSVLERMTSKQKAQSPLDWMRDGLISSPLYVVIRYSDIFDKHHETSVLMNYSNVPQPRWELKFLNVRVTDGGAAS